jgi:hypothetical protein
MSCWGEGARAATSSGAHAVRVNQQIDAAMGRREVEDAIADIRRLLEEKT